MGLSDTTSISSGEVQNLIEALKCNSGQPTTLKKYHGIWNTFNKFLIKLDYVPPSWEERLVYYVAYCVHCGMQSSTIKSYISAIKHVLRVDGYEWQDDSTLLPVLIRSCRLKNDQFKTRLPIGKGLLDTLLFQIERYYDDKQPFLEITYKTIFLLAYYGMMRVGELVTGDHPVLAKDIHVANSKRKLLILLHTSKTHGRGNRPQKIKISENRNKHGRLRNFCPFETTSMYLELRGAYHDINEKLFLFRDNQPVTPAHVRRMLRLLLRSIGLNDKLYGTHSFRIGRATDLSKKGLNIEKIKRIGRWRLNAVYNYLRDL